MSIKYMYYVVPNCLCMLFMNDWMITQVFLSTVEGINDGEIYIYYSTKQLKISKLGINIIKQTGFYNVCYMEHLISYLGE